MHFKQPKHCFILKAPLTYYYISILLISVVITGTQTHTNLSCYVIQAILNKMHQYTIMYEQMLCGYFLYNLSGFISQGCTANYN